MDPETINQIAQKIAENIIGLGIPGSDILAPYVTQWVKGMLPGVSANDIVWDSVVTSPKTASGTYMQRMQQIAKTVGTTAISAQMDENRQRGFDLLQRLLVSEETFMQNREDARTKFDEKWTKTGEGAKALGDWNAQLQKAEAESIAAAGGWDRYIKTEAYQDRLHRWRRDAAERATKDDWIQEDPYNGMSYDQYTNFKVQGGSNNTLLKLLYRELDFFDDAKMGTQLEGLYSNLVGERYALGDRDAFAKASYVTRNLMTEGGAGKFRKEDYGNMDKVGAAFLAKELAKAGDVLEGVDELDNTGQLKSATDKLRQKVQAYARALEPLKDIFGKDVPAMLRTVESIAGMTVATMGVQRAERIATDLADRNSRGLYTSSDLGEQQNYTLQMLDRMETIGLNKVYAPEQTMRMLDMTRGKLRPNWMPQADFDRTVTELVLQSENSDAEDALAAAYGMWKQRKTAEGAPDTSIETFRAEVSKREADRVASGLRGNIVDSAMSLLGVSHPSQLAEGKMYAGYMEAKSSRTAAGMVLGYNAEEEMRIAAQTIGNSVNVRRALKSAGVDTDKMANREIWGMVSGMQQLMLARPELANMTMEKRTEALRELSVQKTVAYTDVNGGERTLDPGSMIGSEKEIRAMSSLFEGARAFEPALMARLLAFHELGKQNQASRKAADRRNFAKELGVAFDGSASELLETLLTGDAASGQKGFSVMATSRVLGKMAAMQMAGLTEEEREEAQLVVQSATSEASRRAQRRLERRDDEASRNAAQKEYADSLLKTRQGGKRLEDMKPEEREALLADVHKKTDEWLAGDRGKARAAELRRSEAFLKSDARRAFASAVLEEETEKARESVLYTLTDARALTGDYRRVQDQQTALHRSYGSAGTPDRNQVEAARAELERTAAEKEKADKTFAETEKNMNSAKARLAEINKQLEDPANSGQLSREIRTDLEKDKKTLTTKISGYEAQLKKAGDAKKAREQEATSARTKYEQLSRKQVEAARAELERTAAEKEKADKTFAETEKNMNSAKARLAEINKQLEDPANSGQLSREIRTDLEKDKKTLTTKISGYEAQLKKAGDAKKAREQEATSARTKYEQLSRNQPDELPEDLQKLDALFEDAKLALRYSKADAVTRWLEDGGRTQESDNYSKTVDETTRKAFDRSDPGYNTESARKTRAAFWGANADEARDIIRGAKGNLDAGTRTRLEKLGFDKATLASMGYKFATEDMSEAQRADVFKANVQQAQLMRLGAVWSSGGAEGVQDTMSKDAIKSALDKSSGYLKEGQKEHVSKLMEHYYKWAEKNQENITAQSFKVYLGSSDMQAARDAKGSDKDVFSKVTQNIASQLVTQAQQGIGGQSGLPTDISGLVSGVSGILEKATNIKINVSELLGLARGWGNLVSAKGVKTEQNPVGN